MKLLQYVLRHPRRKIFEHAVTVVGLETGLAGRHRLAAMGIRAGEDRSKYMSFIAPRGEPSVVSAAGEGPTARIV